MYIKKLRVYNYKSYFDSGVMEFAPGVNIIVGKNNAGKTSLLEVMTLDFKEDHTHKSLKTLPNKSSRIEEESKIEITLQIEKDKLRNFIKNYSPNFLFPLPEGDVDDDIVEISLYDMGRDAEGYNYDSENKINQLVKKAFQKLKNFIDNPDDTELTVTILPNGLIDNELTDELMILGAYSNKISHHFYKFIYGDDNMDIEECHVVDIYNDIEEKYEQEKTFMKYQPKNEETIGYKLFDIFVSRIYRFKAERQNIGSCKFENNEQLKSDASNLAESICILQGKNPGTFAKFNKLVSEILEEIKWISVVPRDNSEVEIKVWIIDPQLNKDDLSLPLSSCGSGVGQVLAIVYILVYSEEPRTLIIDEPQSFLHPGAAKKLIKTIKQFPQHQYFISTHSPDIITTADPSNIIKLKYENCETTTSVIDAKDINLQKEILDELGVRLSDVFGADSVLWVEGPTEEKCFPLIIDKFLVEMPLKGMKILSVKSTDALLDGKHSSLVANIYDKLKSGISLIPEKSIFIFDREKKTDKQIEDLQRIGFKFLKLPMYENYILLNPEAITAIINEEAVWLETPITINQVQEYLEKIKTEKSYLLPGVKEKDVADENWLSKVHGANILENLFQNFCETLLEFKKTTHSKKLTEWIIKYQPEFLSELVEELKECLKKVN
ncbi:AAA family ATPase [Anabaena sp. PCC 7108]|uniref:AAA family ATPase n=1 Tax=Anabaena sp. PCC 7108 TaxID=163908 RepID=UPI0004782DD5|nr:AAA family ATPase [Anabaena sp. PCC 7108]